MALDITGISNDNDFYTDHYLHDVLESDLKDVFSRWKQREDEEGIRPPDAELRSLAKEYFLARGHMEKVRNTGELLNTQRDFLVKALHALGYDLQPSIQTTESEAALPVLGGIKKPDGSPNLWILQALDNVAAPEDPLQQSILPEQYLADRELDPQAPPCVAADVPIEEIITREIFALREPPRWLLICSFSFIVLVDRSKWNEKKLLRFDLPEIFGRREATTFKAMAALLHRDSICPMEGTPLLDNLDENSHKHAFAVSEDLKYSAREAVELLGNEAVWYLREVLKEKVYEIDLAGDLTSECLRYLYRMLFLFYIEARPELGYAPMKSDIYRTGYSLDSLRDLEMVPLTSAEVRNGFYIDDSLKTLFRLVAQGFDPQAGPAELALKDAPLHHTFKIDRLQSHLFDPKRTPIFNRVRLRNKVLQQVIQLLSLSRKSGGRRGRRGRVSYAQLGINQLGAVYEGLLSYRGFFAETDLYEVKRAQDSYDPLGQAFFVPEEALTDYTDEEKVYIQEGPQKGRLIKHSKSSFIYRLAGRDREKSASYYTPEVLTRCLVKYALKELIGEKPDDGKWKTADEILELTVCEPAMGSAAFLNEAVNQLAEAYLQRKQTEMDSLIPVDEYLQEKQKVKMFLADNRVFGVDLNPVAVELAEISLWLNCIHAGNFVPWFGLQLHAGNSLVGARRQVFPSHLVTPKKKGEKSWLDVEPERVPLGTDRNTNTIYHWLLPDPGMADFNDKVIRELAPDAIKKMRDWRKEFRKPFTAADARVLERLSLLADGLWKEHAQQLSNLRKETTDRFPIFGREGDGKLHATELYLKDRKLSQELLSENVRNSSPYRRLKLAMDYWCALWFWPIEQADLLPSRDEYLLELQYILEGQSVQEYGAEEIGQMSLFPETQPRQRMLDLAERLGYVDVNQLCEEFPRLKLVQELADRHRFLHWELEFADLFQRRGGFDLILGNPPWIKVEWNESGILSDYEPSFIVKSLSASRVAELRHETLDAHHILPLYLGEYEAVSGSQNFFTGVRNYPLLKNVQPNLYRCFLPQAWAIANSRPSIGFLHPEGVFDDPHSGCLRSAIYCRLRRHFQFQNEKKLFADIGNRNKFSINIYGASDSSVAFQSISNLFVPQTVDLCYVLATGEVGGIKTDLGQWNVDGHPDRVIRVDSQVLGLFCSLYDPQGTPMTQARLPSVHSVQILRVLERVALHPNRVSAFAGRIRFTQMWDETNAVKKDHVIRRETRFVDKPAEWIISGPHYHVANPFYQTPKAVCETHRAYDAIDLLSLPQDYLPRTNYVPDCPEEDYRERTPDVPWDSNARVTDYYRLVSRRMLSQSGERTLIPCIMPKGIGHINTSFSTTCESMHLLVSFFTQLTSVPLDFFVKSTGKGDARGDLYEQFPFVSGTPNLMIRGLLLTCLTTHYEELWRECWSDDFTRCYWTKEDLRLPNAHFHDITPQWSIRTPVRTDYSRRQLLVEIDVLVARSLGMTLEQLRTAYRVQFPVLRENENDTWYDRNGRIVFTCSMGLPGVGLSRTEWNEAKDMKSGSVSKTITDDTLPGGPVERTITYEAPFDRCDRESDYATAWKAFEERGIQSQSKGGA